METLCDNVIVSQWLMEERKRRRKEQ